MILPKKKKKNPQIDALIFFYSRLQEHECRMLKRGYRVEPSNGPGFCDIDWN